MDERGSSSADFDQPIMPIGRAAIKRQQEIRAAGYVFPLPLTGGHAQVRVPNISDKAFIGALPRDIQGVLAAHLARLGSGESAIKGVSNSEEIAQLNELVSDQERVANELCRVGFIRPKVVLTPREVDPNDEYSVLVTDIHLEDRIAFMELCIAGEREAARTLRTFHRGSVVVIPDEPSNEATAAAFGVPEPDRGRISESSCIDFDLMVETFDIWFEDRANETVEKPAPVHQSRMIQEPKYHTIYEVLGIDGVEIALSEEERQLADLINLGVATDPADLIRFLGGDE